MGQYIRQSCIAVTWTPEGICNGVHLHRKGDTLIVSSFWESMETNRETISSRIADGVKSLGHRDSTYVIVGGSGNQIGMADIQMPKLGINELQNALMFELNRYSPVATENLIHGYRILPETQPDKLNIRLVYLTRENWNTWIDDISSLGHHVDMIMPAIATIDPVLEGQDVFFADKSSTPDKGFLYKAGENGERTIVRDIVQDKEIYGANPQPLTMPNLDLRGLANVEEHKQQLFSDAILLAAYGMTKTSATDVDSWIQVPFELKPKRHRFSKFFAAVITLYLIVTCAMIGYKKYEAATEYNTKLDKQLALLDKQIASFSKTDENDSLTKNLEKELVANYSNRPTMTESLIELTDLISDKHWVHSFSWNNNSIDFTLFTPKDNEDDISTADLVSLLEDSPIFGDVVPGTLRPNYRGGTTRQFTMNARYDIEDDNTKKKNADTDKIIPKQNEPAENIPETEKPRKELK